MELKLWILECFLLHILVCVSIDDEGVILSVVVHETGFKYDMLKTGK
jgi:hypothetical protein